jgi:hypothetical protein
VKEQVYRQKRDRSQVRPFSQAAAVESRGYSQGLQRAMVDFGADESFCDAVEKLKEHYGITVPASAVRDRTQHHAQAMLEGDLETVLPAAGVEQLIAEMDGTMVPIVCFPEPATTHTTKDKRKQRKTEWKQARLVLVRKPWEVSKLYNATMGEARQAGAQLLDLAIAAGAGQKTKMHGLGDGASWIVEQVVEKFGEQASFLVDFYHVSEYLAGAGEAIAGANKREWLSKQQQMLKQSRASEVVDELSMKMESETEQQKREAILACERYLLNRLEHLDYEAAIEAGLPIGSGEVESGHRSVIQERLKLSGAWWRIENAEKMLALRAVRANGRVQSYWDNLRQAAA